MREILFKKIVIPLAVWSVFLALSSYAFQSNQAFSTIVPRPYAPKIICSTCSIENARSKRGSGQCMMQMSAWQSIQQKLRKWPKRVYAIGGIKRKWPRRNGSSSPKLLSSSDTYLASLQQQNLTINEITDEDIQVNKESLKAAVQEVQEVFQEVGDSTTKAAKTLIKNGPQISSSFIFHIISKEFW